MEKLIQNQKLKIIATIIIVGFAISVFYHYLISPIMGIGYPFNTFLFNPADKFNDFFNIYNHIVYNGKQVFPLDHNFANYLLYIPSLFSFHSQNLAYLLYAGLFIAYFYSFNYIYIKQLKKSNNIDWSLLKYSFVFTFLTYPVLFVLDRGNSEMYIFILLSLSMIFYSDKKYLVSAIMLGLAVHLKIYYVVFLLIFFVDKKYREIGVVILLFLILPFIAFIIDKLLFPTLQFSSSIFAFLKSAANSENWYNNLYVLGDGGAAYCSSLYGGLKAILYLIFPDIKAGSIPIQLLFKLYFPISLLCAGLTTLYLILLEKETWKKVALVTFILILCPYVTGDYRLIMLFIPLWLFINSTEHSRYNVIYAILFSLLLIPKDYYIIRDCISISVILNPLIIIIFIALLLKEGISKWAEQNLEKFRRIKKSTLYVFLVSLIISIVITIGGIWFMFTPKGNDFIKSKLTTYLSKRFNTTVNFQTFKFTTKEICIALDIKMVAKIHISASVKNSILLGDYKFDIMDASKISKRFYHKLEFSTYGKISGSGINNVILVGNTNIFHSTSNYSIDFKNRKLSRIKFDLNNIRMGEALSVMNKKENEIVGNVDLKGNVFVENLRPTIGQVHFSADSLVVIDSSFISKSIGLSVPNNTKVKIITATIFNGKEAVSRININSQIAQITMRENIINLLTKNKKSDFLIKISNLNDINFTDKANNLFINNQLHNLKKFKNILSKKYQGGVLITGNINKNDDNFVTEGAAIDFPDKPFKESNYNSKFLPFRLENNKLIINDISFKN